MHKGIHLKCVNTVNKEKKFKEALSLSLLPCQQSTSLGHPKNAAIDHLPYRIHWERQFRDWEEGGENLKFTTLLKKLAVIRCPVMQCNNNNSAKQKGKNVMLLLSKKKSILRLFLFLWRNIWDGQPSDNTIYHSGYGHSIFFSSSRDKILILIDCVK